MNAIFYPAIFHPEETGYSVEIPDIEGCFTQGDTMDEAVRMAQDAIGLCWKIAKSARSLLSLLRSTLTQKILW